jgi:hypothetical protein
MGLTEQELLVRTQKYLEVPPACVVGSGLSCAEGLPGMGALRDYLLTRVAADAHETAEWQRVRDRLATEDLETALNAVSVGGSLRSKIVRATHALIVDRERAVVDRVLRGHALPLATLLHKLLGTTARHATVVTTNYDRLVELAVEQAEAVAYAGFTLGHVRRPDGEARWRITRAIGRTPVEERTVDVWKVHGSVDWFHVGNGVQATGFIDEAIASHEPAMVAPGSAKYAETHQEPYRSISTLADAALAKAPAFLCLGYGFNDEHVQPKLLARARSGVSPTPLIVLAQALTPAARKLIIDAACPKYTIYTEGPSGTIVYTNDVLGGTEIGGNSLWSLQHFLKWLWG